MKHTFPSKHTLHHFAVHLGACGALTICDMTDASVSGVSGVRCRPRRCPPERRRDRRWLAEEAGTRRDTSIFLCKTSNIKHFNHLSTSFYILRTLKTLNLENRVLLVEKWHAACFGECLRIFLARGFRVFHQVIALFVSAKSIRLLLLANWQTIRNHNIHHSALRKSGGREIRKRCSMKFAQVTAALNQYH